MMEKRVSLKYKCELFDSLEMLLQVCSNILAKFLNLKKKAPKSPESGFWISNARVEV